MQDWQPRLGPCFMFPLLCCTSFDSLSDSWPQRIHWKRAAFLTPSTRRRRPQTGLLSKTYFRNPFVFCHRFPTSLKITVDVTLVGGLPTGPVIRITAPRDTGFDLLTCYIRDLLTLGSFNQFANALGPIIPVRTSAGIVHRQITVGAVRL